MRIVMASAEVSPLAKTGGLADVVGALPSALQQLGFEVIVVSPAFRSTIARSRAQAIGLTVSVPVSDRTETAEVYRGALPDGTPVYLLRHDAYFDREALYGTAQGDFADNAERFAFFCRAVLSALSHLGAPAILHCHDWQSALAIAFLRVDSARYPDLAGMRTILTVHNLGYQGFFWALDWHLLNLDFSFFSPRFLEFWGHINYLKSGLVFADAITTVSPTYAREICTPEYGEGLDGVLRERRSVLRGILNGVDYNEWSPENDRHLACPYSASSPSGKADCKRALQRELGLPISAKTPLIGMISRLAVQKGIDLLLEAGPALQARAVQIAILGTGDPHFEEDLRTWSAQATPSVAVRLTFDEGLAHRFQSGCDMLLMPSRYEPCGLNQIYALRYGTIPVVRATGGLDDSIEDYNPATNAGTGFKFGPYSADQLLAAIDRARGWYRQQEVWRLLIDNAMKADFSWQRSARQYADLYRELAGERENPPASIT